ncbi:hypothetical protein MKX34_11665 [Paenibacillus sp. FSL R5-0636]|nr:MULTISPECIES: hypothetical protein [Paenibacillus]
MSANRTILEGANYPSYVLDSMSEEEMIGEIEVIGLEPVYGEEAQ